MASSFASLDPAGSPLKPASSVIHLCISVNRTVSGSVSGYLSASAIAMSSKLSQLNVCGIRNSLLSLPRVGSLISVVGFLGVILVPVGNLHDDVRGAVWHGLAA